MMHRTIVMTLGLVAGLAAVAAAQEPAPEERARIQQEMMAAMQPGPEHARLVDMAGEWNIEVRMWPAPDAEPMISTGTASNRMILGGRFLESRSEAGADPMRIESLILLGFDRRRSEYTLIALDTWGTYYVTAAGPADASGRMTLDGVNDDPISKVRETYQMIYRPIDADTFVHEVVFTDPAHAPGGEPFRILEITFRRR
jgi:hypothetical protein